METTSLDIKLLITQVRALTEKNRALETYLSELKYNETRLLQIINHLPHFIFVKDVHGKFLFVNQSMADAYDLTVDEMIGCNHQSIHKQKKEVELYLSSDKKVIETNKEVFIPEEYFTDKYGSQRVFQTIRVPFEMFGSNQKTVLGICADISGEHQATEALFNTEFKLSEAQRFSQTGCWEWDLSQNQITRSEEVFKILHMSKEYLGETFDDYKTFIHPEDRPFVLDSIQNAILTNKPCSIDYRFVHPEKKELYLTEHIRIYNVEKEYKVIGTVQNRTRTFALEQKNAWLKEALNLADKPIASIDQKQQIIFANKTFRMLFGMNNTTDKNPCNFEDLFQGSESVYENEIYPCLKIAFEGSPQNTSFEHISRQRKQKLEMSLYPAGNIQKHPQLLLISVNVIEN